MYFPLTFISLLICLIPRAHTRSHQLILKNDVRQSVLCSQFGFYQWGTLSFNVEKLDIGDTISNDEFGFTLDKASNAGVSNYVERTQHCLLSDKSIIEGSQFSAIIFKINKKDQNLTIERVGVDLKDLVITVTSAAQNVSGSNHNQSETKTDKSTMSFPLKVSPKGHISFKMLLQFNTKELEGLYSLYFHNCARNRELKTHGANLTISIIEKNKNSFLSAGDMPLPSIFFAFSGIYMFITLVWFAYLKFSDHNVFKIHYLMLLLIFVKSVALVFHGTNYYVLGKEGIHEEGWAVMYYITHLLKGALLFVTIVLIGTGWAFVKHMLTNREKKVFLIIIPLQILANVATIIIDESEEGTTRYTTWKEILILVDLVCCGAILFPVVWSIRHLQQAAETDGKAAVNLQKLKLFRHFYIMIIVYIYFTRIVVYLLTITVPFSLLWMVEVFKELGTLVFLTVTVYKFRPLPNNPYLLVPLDEEEEAEERRELEHVWSQSGINDGVVHLKHFKKTQDNSDTEDHQEGSGEDTKKARDTTKVKFEEGSHVYD